MFFACFQLFAENDYNIELYSIGSNGKLVSSEEILKQSDVKFLIVDFFSLACDPCKRSLPLWDQFYKENRSKGFEFLLVSLPAKGEGKKPEKDLKNYFKQYNFSFKIVFDKYSAFGKKFGAVTKSNDVKLPMIFVIDKSGNLLFKAESYDEAMSKIKELK